MSDSSATKSSPHASQPAVVPSRRGFLVAGGAALLGGATTEAQAVVPAPPATPDQVAAPAPSGYVFFTSVEAETVTAMVGRLIPSDQLGPGAVEAGVVTFLDRQMGSQYGAAARWYRTGPWMSGTPSQGWQLPQTPAQIYRMALLALDRWCQGNHEARFKDLAAKDQDQVLTLLEGGKIDLDGLSSAVFFQLLWQNTVEGYFADPVYGGNRNMAAWRMIGFPGANPILTEAVDLDGDLYRIDPMAIGS